MARCQFESSKTSIGRPLCAAAKARAIPPATNLVGSCNFVIDLCVFSMAGVLPHRDGRSRWSARGAVSRVLDEREAVMKHVDVKTVGEVVILTPRRALFGDDETFELGDLIQKFNDEGNRYLVIDLARVKRINSTGLGVLINGHKQYGERGGGMRLCSLQANAVALLAVAKLTATFDIHDNLEGAFASFLTGDGAGATERAEELEGSSAGDPT